MGFVVEFAGDLRGRVERLGLKQPILVGLDLFGEEMLGEATGSPAGWMWLWFSAGERADKTQMPRRFGSVVSSTGLNWNDVDIFLCVVECLVCLVFDSYHSMSSCRVIQYESENK